MGDLLSFLEGGVLGMTDLKTYSKQGKLDMIHTLKLSQAVEHLLEKHDKADKSYREGSAFATPVRSPRKGAERSRPSSEKEKEQIGLISKVLDDFFDVVRDILPDGDDVQSTPPLLWSLCRSRSKGEKTRQRATRPNVAPLWTHRSRKR